MDAGLEAFGETSRFEQLSKLLPVSAVIATVCILYFGYFYLHCLRLFQSDLPPEKQNSEMLARGYWQTVTFHVVTTLLSYCLLRCIFTSPGTVPDGQGWELKPDEEGAEGNEHEGGPHLVEKKHTGERRHCKWCLKYKPDRTHHCRVCNLCVLKMDHHCPWIYNCVGFRNHKFFFLLLVYALLDLSLVSITMFDTVWWSTRVDVSIVTMISLLFGETLAMFLLVLIIAFLSFHVWLMTKAMTTVEFCEKSLKKASYNSSIYSRGFYGNVCAVLGPQPLLWFLPLSFPEGDGLTWPPSKESQGRQSLLQKRGSRVSFSSATGDEAQTSRSSRKKGTSRST
mmetsp:Transcript_99362/g.155365  ORF Transcript_99362/g.155365 Transcript_99362/m.155365 type:complete len:339 (+) Transcript_99362:104-1120(+)